MNQNSHKYSNDSVKYTRISLLLNTTIGYLSISHMEALSQWEINILRKAYLSRPLATIRRTPRSFHVRKPRMIERFGGEDIVTYHRSGPFVVWFKVMSRVKIDTTSAFGYGDVIYNMIYFYLVKYIYTNHLVNRLNMNVRH